MKWNVLIMEIFIVLITFIGSPNTSWIKVIRWPELNPREAGRLIILYWQGHLHLPSTDQSSPADLRLYEVLDATSNAHSSY